jgi:hypothetical protein
MHAAKKYYRLQVMANVPSSPILVTLAMEVLHSSETSVLTRAIWRNIPEDGIQHSSYSPLWKPQILHKFHESYVRFRTTLWHHDKLVQVTFNVMYAIPFQINGDTALLSCPKVESVLMCRSRLSSSYYCRPHCVRGGQKSMCKTFKIWATRIGK